MSANVKQCKECGRLFQSYGSYICSECVEDMDKEFMIVKNYIYDYPEAKLIEISKETGVSEKRVLIFLREGRLSLSTADGILECEKCGKPISSGKLCSDCKSKLENMLNSVCKHEPEKKEKPKSSASAKMHIRHRI